jgi:2-dehydropantoate 2-reductase
MKIKNVALIGLGAIGTVYGHLLYQKYGVDFSIIANGARKRRLEKDGAILNHQTFTPRILSAPESEKIDFLIVCVKNYQLDDAITDMRPFLKNDTVILTLLNGITAKDRLSEAFPGNTVLYGLSIYIDALKTADGVTNTLNGIIQFGNADNTVPSEEVLAVHEFLTNAGIEAQICTDMIYTIWRKWLMNVGINQVSAITGSPYGRLVDVESTRILVHDAMMEVVALAQSKGIGLTEEDIFAFERILTDFSPNGKTSMLQDVQAKRKTEVDSFSGTVLKLGKLQQIPTPVNHVLFHLIKSIEALY